MGDMNDKNMDQTTSSDNMADNTDAMQERLAEKMKQDDQERSANEQ